MAARLTINGRRIIDLPIGSPRGVLEKLREQAKSEVNETEGVIANHERHLREARAVLAIQERHLREARAVLAIQESTLLEYTAALAFVPSHEGASLEAGGE